MTKEEERKAKRNLPQALQEVSDLKTSIAEYRSELDKLKERQAAVSIAPVEQVALSRGNQEKARQLEALFDRHKAFTDEQAKRFVFTILSYHEKNCKLEAAVSRHSKVE